VSAGAIFALLQGVALPERVGGLLIDLDGTVIEGGEPIPGAAEALRVLIQKEIPYRVVTNTTSKPRSVILANLSALGIEVRSEQLVTAPIIGRGYLLREGITRCFLLLKTSLLEDLATIEFVDGSPQAVLVGDIATN
jgi:phospholysine phosphohistidine inorganic pyrophosphate phosphatase